MANRCPDCNKFVSLENQDPEVESLELDVQRNADGPVGLFVSAEVKICRACQDCGTEIRTNTFTFEQDLGDLIRAGLTADCKVDRVTDMHAESTPEEVAKQTAADKADNEHGFGIHMNAQGEDGSEDNGHTLEIEENEVEFTEVTEKGKTSYGVILRYAVQCSCGATLHEGQFEDKILGSEMEEA